MASLATYLSVAVATVLWGANFNLAKPVVAEMRPLIAAADRFLIAAGIMLVITYATGNRLTWRHARIYLILGLLFTFLYGALDRVQSGNFFGQGVVLHTGDTIFFSFTTLTTTGYGDLVPASQPGKMFAGLEMLMGQIFLVTLVAGLVSLWRPGSRLRR